MLGTEEPAQDTIQNTAISSRDITVLFISNDAMVAIVKQNRKSVLIKQRKGVCGSKEPGSRSLKRWSLGVPTVAQWVKDQAFSLSLRWYRFNPGPAPWVKDRHCCSCGSHLVPSL